MLLTLKEIDRLARCETVFLDQHSEHNITWDQFRELVEAAKEGVILRELLALGHGCQVMALYGDDGELQCAECFTDFKRDSVSEIQRKIQRRNLERAAALKGANSC